MDPFSVLCPPSCVLGARSRNLLQDQLGMAVRSLGEARWAQGSLTLPEKGVDKADTTILGLGVVPVISKKP